MVIAQDLSEAGDRLLVQATGRLEVPEGAMSAGEVIHGRQRLGMVIAEHSPVGVQGAGMPLLGALEVAEGSLGFGQIIARG